MKVFQRTLALVLLSIGMGALASGGRRLFSFMQRLLGSGKTDRARRSLHERALIDSVQDLIWLKDLEGRYVRVNQAFLDHYHQPRPAIEGHTDEELFAPELAAIYRQQDRQALDQATPSCFEDRIDGANPRWYETILTPIRDALGGDGAGAGEPGAIVGLAGVSRDITERKLAVQRLDEFYHRLTWATRAGRFGVWDWDVANDKLQWDEQMFVLYGMPPPQSPREELVGGVEAWAAAVLPEDLPDASENVRAALRGEREFSTQFRVRWPDGSIRYLRGVGMVERDMHGNAVRMIGMNWDVTEQTNTLNALELRERELDAMLENIPAMVFVKDAAELRFVRFNKAGEELMGLSREELLGCNDFDIFPHEMAQNFIATDRHTIARGGIEDVPEESVQTRYGRKLMHTRKVSIPGPDGKPRYLMGISEDITARKEVEQQQRRLLEILDSAKDLIALVDQAGRIIYINGAGRKMLGFGEAESVEGVQFHEIYSPGLDRQSVEDLLSKAGREGHADSETRFRSRAGREFPASQVIAAHRDTDGELTHYSIIARDIREHKRLLKHYMLSDKVFTFTAEAIMITDSSCRIISVNQAFTTMTGYTLDEVKGCNPSILSSGKQASAFYEEMWETVNASGHWEGELWDRRKDGAIYPKWLSINAVKEPGSNVISHYIGIFSDISLRKQQEDHIRHLAFHDALTGLPNRSLFQDRLRHALAESRRDSLPIALMLLDLDHFKYINDTLGHHVGDQLLKEIAMRLVGCVRESDTIARLGGDEFVIILNGVHDLRDVVPVVEKILSEMARPMRVNNHQFRVTASLGIALYPDDASNIDDLIRNADTAMYHAKDGGRANYQFFTPRMNEAAHERVMIEEHLRRGLDLGEFELYYQPKISLKPLRLAGCEALLRWNHPEWGTVLPTRFIPIAEDSGLILPLGEWVIGEACRQARAWLESGLRLQVAINLSGRQFRDSNLILKIRKAMEDESGIARWMELEITESTLIEGASHAAQTLQALHQLSLPLAVDDFGTGYSSLSYLKTFAIDTLKIDKSFVDGIDRNPNDATIIRAVISLAHQLGMKVVAEGVEEAGQLQFLEKLRCDMIQGYYFSEPLRADAFETYARREFPAAFTSYN